MKRKDLKKRKGVPQSDLSLVAHEMEHQYDKEKNNQADATDTNNADNPSEQRAVRTENEARKVEGLPLRTTYGGRKVPTNPQNYILPNNQKEEKKKN